MREGNGSWIVTALSGRTLDQRFSRLHFKAPPTNSLVYTTATDLYHYTVH